MISGILKQIAQLVKLSPSSLEFWGPPSWEVLSALFSQNILDSLPNFWDELEREFAEKGAERQEGGLKKNRPLDQECVKCPK